jgi:hypothetical protein
MTDSQLIDIWYQIELCYYHICILDILEIVLRFCSKNQYNTEKLIVRLNIYPDYRLIADLNRKGRLLNITCQYQLKIESARCIHQLIFSHQDTIVRKSDKHGN